MATLPTIHLNGTSADRLFEELAEATGALRAAHGALQRAAPNGRDYYPQGADALRAAEAEHVARLRKLESVREELETILEHVAEERDKRAARRR